jgi:hypothetical protein
MGIKIQIVKERDGVMIAIIGSSLCAYSVASTLDAMGLNYQIITVDKSFQNNEIQPPANYGITTIESLTPAGGSSVWHGVVASPNESEINEIAGKRPKIERGDLQEALKMLNVPTQSIENILANNFERVYYTPTAPFSTKKWLKKNSNKVIYDSVLSIKQGEGGVDLKHKSGKKSTFKYVFIAAGPLQTFTMISRSLCNTTSSSIYSDHVGFPIGTISHKAFVKHLKPLFNSSYRDKLGYIKKGIDFNVGGSDSAFALFIRPTISKKLNIKEERARSLIVDYRSGKLSFKKIINVILSVDSLLKLIYLKTGNRVGLKINPKFYELMIVAIQSRNTKERTISFESSTAKLKWGFDKGLIADVRSSLNRYFLAKSMPLESINFYTDEVAEVVAGTAHIAGTCVDFLNTESYELNFCKNAFLCGSSTFEKPIVPNNSLTAMAQSIRVAKLILKS